MSHPVADAICSHATCERACKGSGFCPAHLRHLRLYGETRELRAWRPSGATCSFKDCGRAHYSTDLCATHYYQTKRGLAPQAIEVTLPCAMPRCLRGARGRILCAKHHRRAVRYGISDERLIELVADATCDICGSDEPGGLDFAIDHDHACCPDSPACGKCVRGVLCTACNMGLGAFGDDVETLRTAIAYLENAA